MFSEMERRSVEDILNQHGIKAADRIHRRRLATSVSGAIFEFRSRVQRNKGVVRDKEVEKNEDGR
jgi:hypothetical protein